MLKQIYKKFLRFKDHFILIFSSNFTGLLNLILALFILKTGSEVDYNLYTASASVFVIFSAPSKIIKNLATLYGRGLIEKIEYLKSKYFFFLVSLLALFLIFLTSKLTPINLITSSFLVAASIIQFYLLFFVGVLQNNKHFSKSSIILILQNVFKLNLGVIAFSIFFNAGIWGVILLTSFSTTLFLYFDFNSKVNNIKNKINLNYKDIFLNILLFVFLEILFNIDSLVIIKNLESDSAYIYNSLIIVKKSLFFSIFAIGNIVLSDSRKVKTKSRNTLFVNLLFFLFIAIGLSAFFILFRDFILKFINLTDISFVLYLKFLTGSFLFSLLYILTLWFTSFKKYHHRIIIIFSMILFLIYYINNINSADQILNKFIFGNLCLILLELFLIFVRKFQKKA